ncbi:MAG: hypothetical protein K8I60_20860, partial [Anaerolineae bacterium]|nr:hypothetical protein [Anaerolineae bacterium]
SEDSEETGEGRARIRVMIAADVSGANVQASNDQFGDPVKFESEQTIQLLRLWDPHNKEITDLGDLGEPETAPFIVHALLFDKAPSDLDGEVNPAFQEFVRHLFLPVVRPFLEKIAFENAGGFASSALKAILVRWDIQLPDFVSQPNINLDNDEVIS